MNKTHCSNVFATGFCQQSSYNCGTYLNAPQHVANSQKYSFSGDQNATERFWWLSFPHKVITDEAIRPKTFHEEDKKLDLIFVFTKIILSSTLQTFIMRACVCVSHQNVYLCSEHFMYMQVAKTLIILSVIIQNFISQDGKLYCMRKNCNSLLF